MYGVSIRAFPTHHAGMRHSPPPGTHGPPQLLPPADLSWLRHVTEFTLQLETPSVDVFRDTLRILRKLPQLLYLNLGGVLPGDDALSSNTALVLECVHLLALKHLVLDNDIRTFHILVMAFDTTQLTRLDLEPFNHIDAGNISSSASDAAFANFCKNLSATMQGLGATLQTMEVFQSSSTLCRTKRRARRTAPEHAGLLRMRPAHEQWQD